MRSILFYLGPVPIRAYGLMLWIGLVVGLIRTIRVAKDTSIKPENVVDAVLISLITGVFTAHVTSIILDLPYYWQRPSEILGLWTGILSPEGGLKGLSFHGGLAGGLLAAFLYSRKKAIPFLELADLCSPGLILAYGFTRIGCFLNGCCYGIPTSLPWGVRFHLDPVSPEMTAPSHPTQLYSAAAAVLLFMALRAIEKRRRFVGQVFVSFLCLYSLYRFLLEFLRRGVTAEVVFLGLTEAQLVSLLILAFTIPILWKKLRATDQTSSVAGNAAKRYAKTRVESTRRG